MATDFFSLEPDAVRRIREAQTVADLHRIEHWIFGRKRGALTLEMRALRDLPDAERKERGGELNRIKGKLEEEIGKRRSELEGRRMESLASQDAFDLTMDLPDPGRGHLHLIPEFISQVEEVFGRMGFSVAYGPEIETEEMNFDLLNFPKDHPARDSQGTFWVKEGKGDNGKGKRVLRTHTSPVQIRYMREHKPPFRMICPGVVYRRDEDATHSPMFHQCEGLMIGRDVSLRHMKGVMIAAVKELVSPDIVFRFRTSYYPFVEPGLDLDMQWRGEKQTREGEWLEVAGCGMVHPNVLCNVGIDPKRWQGFAFGFGVERLLMIRHRIPSIRLFYQGDMRFLRQW